jgi:hypothetical protein
MTPEPDDLPIEGPFEPLAPEAEEELAAALRAAFAPAQLDPARHRQILEMALEDPLAPPTEDEMRESERLRIALETSDTGHPDAALARALKTALAPNTPGTGEAERAAERLSSSRPRGRVIYVSFGAVALAAAAAFALFVARPDTSPTAQRSGPAAATRGVETARALAASRTTGDLFSERFEPGKATDRIDRIALVRERELRENRYALWGVR